MRRAWVVLHRIWVGFFEDDGFILSGYLAYLTLLALFPFILFLFSLTAAFGQSAEGLAAINGLFSAMPPNVAAVLQGPVQKVLEQRASGSTGGGLLTLGIGVAIWTAASFIETVRVIIHRAYNHSSGRPMWQQRLHSFAIVIGSGILVLVGMSVSFALAGVKHVLIDELALTDTALQTISLIRFALTPAILFIALYGLFLALTPRGLAAQAMHWPGALLTVGAWLAAAAYLPRLIAAFGTYDLTYGSLAGIIIALLFFYVVGLAFVLGAQLNAAIKWSQSQAEQMRV